MESGGFQRNHYSPKTYVDGKDASWVHPLEGTLHDLWTKALVLEDISGKQAVLVTTDLVGIPKNISDRIRDQLESRFHLSISQIILNSSHTHSGPVLEDALSNIYPLDSQQLKPVEQYSDIYRID